MKMMIKKQSLVSVVAVMILMLGIFYPMCEFSYAEERGEYPITLENGVAMESYDGTKITKAKEGSKVYLLANDAPEGMIFDRWEVLAGDVKIYLTSPYNDKAYYDFTMPEGAVHVRAKYRAIKSEKVDVSINLDESGSSNQPTLNVPYEDLRTYVIDILRNAGKLKFAGGSAGSGEIGYQEAYTTANGIEISCLDYRYKRLVSFVQSGKNCTSTSDDIHYTLTEEDYARFKAEGKLKYLEIRSVSIVFGKAPQSRRIAGNDRYETSLKVADELKATMNIDKFDAAVVAYGDNYADALSGAYLAKVNNAPLLLINEHNMQGAIDYINNNLRPGKSSKVYLLGGTKVMPELMKTKLENNFTVKRISGEDRFETNMAILKEAGVSNEEMVVCSAYGFADSLAASATGRPILLVGDALTDEQKAYLKSINTRKYTITGGYKSVNVTAEGWLRSLGNVSRVFGNDRYETSVAIAKHFFNNPKSVVVGNGDNFPDGLCGGVLAERRGASMILINEHNVAYAKDYVSDNGIRDLLVLGGSRLITDEMIRVISN